MVQDWRKANWKLFKDTIERTKRLLYVPKMINEKKLDKMVDKMYRSINHALAAAVPMKELEHKNSTYDWYGEEHKKLSKKVKAAYKAYIKKRAENKYNKYRKVLLRYKNKCKRDKRKSWYCYTEGMDEAKEVARMTKFLRGDERKMVSLLERPDGSVTDPGSDTILELSRAHFPNATDEIQTTYSSVNNTVLQDIKDAFKDWIDMDKTIEALRGFDKKKSPGPDGLRPLIFEHLPGCLLEYLMIIYKSCIFLHYTPKLWRDTKVIFIPKPGKESYRKAKSFRPISLSNYLLKGLERLVAWRMDKALLEFPIHKKQHGFQKGRSTESALSNTV